MVQLCYNKVVTFMHKYYKYDYTRHFISEEHKKDGAK